MTKFETTQSLREKAAGFAWHTADNGDTLRDAGLVLAAIVWGAVLTRWALQLFAGV